MPTQRWYFTMICDFQDRAQDRSVKGSFQRTEVSSSLKSQLARTGLLEQAKIYAESQIWQEALNTFAQLRREKPTEWEE
ncbi:DUF928 domain-containing protein [Nostoc sp.]|uniref:DUF928 domain-containing protein n=1 Tax=Nostoc sp. TaxID=1180 RepID=UPI002FFC9AA1